MFLISSHQNDVFSYLDQIGLKDMIHRYGTVLIKVNLAHPPQPGHPRTDPLLISMVTQYVEKHNGICAICEGADGFLTDNLKAIGLGSIVNKTSIRIIDLDLEEFDCVVIEDEEHFIPKCLRNYQVRIGIPATSKRSEMVFSNNIKLFVGAVPRRMYQIGDMVSWRPRVHINLHKSVTNIYRAIKQYAPFSYFINGGLAMDENRGEFMLDNIYIGNDAIELDQYMLENIFGLEPPDYMLNLAKDL